MNIIEINDTDLKKLKSLFVESATYYEQKDDNGETKPWNMNDVNSQIEIFNEVYAIIEPLIENL
jgi:hypothetical protein